MINVFGYGAETDEGKEQKRSPNPLGRVIFRLFLHRWVVSRWRFCGFRIPHELLVTEIFMTAAEIHVLLALFHAEVHALVFVAVLYVDDHAVFLLHDRFFSFIVGAPQRDARLAFSTNRGANLFRRQTRLRFALFRFIIFAGDCLIGMIRLFRFVVFSMAVSECWI